MARSATTRPVKITNGTQPAVADMRNTERVHRFGNHRDFAKIRRPFQHHFRLHDVETASFQQGSELMNTAIAFATRVFHFNQTIQFCEVVEVIARERLS